MEAWEQGWGTDTETLPPTQPSDNLGVTHGWVWSWGDTSRRHTADPGPGGRQHRSPAGARLNCCQVCLRNALTLKNRAHSVDPKSEFISMKQYARNHHANSMSSDILEDWCHRLLVEWANGLTSIVCGSLFRPMHRNTVCSGPHTHTGCYRLAVGTRRLATQVSVHCVSL